MNASQTAAAGSATTPTRPPSRPTTARIRTGRIWVPVARVILAAVLLAAAWPKIVSPRQSVLAVSSYQLLPDPASEMVGHGLPFAEAGLAVLLLLGLAIRPVALVTAALLLVFAAAIVSAWARGLSIDCGCFGGGGATEDPDYLVDLVRDLVLAVLAGAVARWPHPSWSLDGALSEESR